MISIEELPIEVVEMILYQVIRRSGPHYSSDWWDLWKSDSHYDALFRLVFHSIILKADTSIDQHIALHNSLEIYTFDRKLSNPGAFQILARIFRANQNYTSD